MTLYVKTKSWINEGAIVPLEAALTPWTNLEGGAVEEAAAQAEKNAQVLGRLLAALVEHGKLTLDDARGICGIYHELIPVDSSDPDGTRWDARVLGGKK